MMTQRTDSQLQQDVLRELKWDTRVEESEIGVSVHEGVITLAGTVRTYSQRLAAQEAAHRVSGVLDVANEIEVKLPGDFKRDDTDIARAVRQALEWDVQVPDSRIQSTVSAGVVTLEGEVDFFSEHEDAERAVRNLVGVCAIRNRIQIRPSKIAKDIHLAIEGALNRHAKHEANHVHLTVRDGVAEISGTVNSWADKQAVIGAAKGTPGVRVVEDHVSIEN